MTVDIQTNLLCEKYFLAEGQQKINLRRDLVRKGAPVIESIIDHLCTKANRLNNRLIPQGDAHYRIVKLYENMHPNLHMSPDAIRAIVQKGGPELEEYIRMLEEVILTAVAKKELEKSIKAAADVFIELAKSPNSAIDREVDLAFDVSKPYRGWAMALILFYSASSLGKRILDWNNYGPRMGGIRGRSPTRDQVAFGFLWNFIGANSGIFGAKADLEAMIARDPEHGYSEYEERTITIAYICFVLA